MDNTTGSAVAWMCGGCVRTPQALLTLTVPGAVRCGGAHKSSIYRSISGTFTDFYLTKNLMESKMYCIETEGLNP